MIVSFLFTTGVNFGFYTKYVRSHGGMTYGYVEAAKKVYEHIKQRTPVKHELYLELEKLQEGELLIGWHESFKDDLKKIEEGKKTEPVYYILSRKRNPEWPQKIKDSSQLIGEVNFLDAPPFGFRIFKAIYGVLEKEQIFVFKIASTVS